MSRNHECYILDKHRITRNSFSVNLKKVYSNAKGSKKLSVNDLIAYNTFFVTQNACSVLVLPLSKQNI